MEIREKLHNKYYKDWQQKYSTWNKKDEEITDEYLLNMYQEYIDKLNEFLDEISVIENTITKEESAPNIRQDGGFKRCAIDYPDKGWKQKYQQYEQAYKEMMHDFLYYSPELEYDEMSINEIRLLKIMADKMIERAETYIKEIKGIEEMKRERKQISSFNEFETEIHNMCHHGNLDYDRIDYLLKNGASANAIEIVEWNDGDKDEELLLTQCWNDGRNHFIMEGKRDTEKEFCLRILQIFINNGLDIDKYVNHIFGDIQWTYDANNYIEMTKLILNHLTNKDNLNLEKALDGIGTEESYNNCCEADHEYANVLSTMYEMIEGYHNGDDVNKFFNCKQAIGQKILSVDAYIKDLKVDFSNKLIADEFDIIIKCEKDSLLIKNKYIFINNNTYTSKFERINEENNFIKTLNNSIVGEKIENIELKNVSIESSPKTHYNITKIVITLTSENTLTIDLDEAISNMRIIYNSK